MASNTNSGDWEKVREMILKKIPADKIIEFTLKNKVCLEKNVDGKSLLLHAIENNRSTALEIIKIKTNFVNEENALDRVNRTNDKEILNLLNDKKINISRKKH